MALPDDPLLPWWLERQLDPSGPDVVPGPDATVNTTHRDWVLLGTVGAPERAVVDPRGLVTPWTGGWSLDWWVGAEDRWHLPSRAAGVRQRLVGGAPVVETALRIPSGDLLHRAWAVAAGEGVPGGGAVVVELENASPVPVAVALAIRPWNPIGAAPVNAVDLDGNLVMVDGFAAMVLPKTPSRVAVGDAVADAVAVVVSGDAATEWPEGGARCSRSGANAAFLFPLPHTAVLRVALPLVPVPTGTTRRRLEGVAALAALDPKALPDAERVASGWEVQTRRAPRLELPEPRVDEALVAARRHALLHTAGDDAGAWPLAVVPGLDTAELAVALDEHGLHAEAERLLVGFADRQGLDGSFGGETQRADAAAAWMAAVGRHVRLSGRPELAQQLVGPLAKAAHHVHRRHLSRRARRGDGGPNLLPGGAGPSWVDDDAVTFHDALWSWRGLVEAAFALDAAGQPDAADEVRGFAAGLADALAALLDAGPEDGAPTLGPGQEGPGRRAAGTLATAVALGDALAGPAAPPAGSRAALERAVDLLATVDPAPAVWHARGHAGLSPRLTAGLARAEVAVASPGAVDRLRWLLDAGSPLWRWPELVHPRTGGGCGGQGHDGPSTAAVLRLVRALAATETADGLDLLPAVPPEWYGNPVEVHGLPTAWGLLSFAVRWHGERPALLWELVAHTDAAVAAAVTRELPGPPVLRSSGLDPSWRSTELRGEALLAVPPRAEAARTDGPAEVAGPPEPPAEQTAAPEPPAAPATPERPPAPPPTLADPGPDGGSSFT